MKKLLAIALLAISTSVLADIRVVDGDTINTPMSNVQNMPTRISVRLIGVNTPESRGACKAEIDAALRAKNYIRDRITAAKTVTVISVKWDKYGGRVDGVLMLDGKDIVPDIIAGGYGVAYSGGVRTNVWCPAK